MGILDGIVDWLATQVMNLLDLASTSVLGALDCNMDTFKRYFPAASAMYEIFIWTAIGLVLLNLVWQLYRCYGAGFDIDTENPTNLVVRSVIFLLLIWYCDDIVNLALQIGGTPYNWILDSNLPGVQFGDFNSVLLVIIGVIANGSVALIALILVMVLACPLQPAFGAGWRYGEQVRHHCQGWCYRRCNRKSSAYLRHYRRCLRQPKRVSALKQRGAASANTQERPSYFYLSEQYRQVISSAVQHTENFYSVVFPVHTVENQLL